MGNKNDNRKNLWIYAVALIVFASIAFASIALWMEQHGYSSFLSNILQFIGIILQFIGIIVSIILAKRSSSSIQCNNKNEVQDNEVQDEDSIEKQNDEAQRDGQCLWRNLNRRRIFISFAIVFVLLFVGSLCYKLHDYRNQRKEHLLQQQFDEVVGKYNNRMQQKLTYYNAYELITEDYALLKQILQMLNNTHDLKADPRNDYKEKFQKRADTAMLRISKIIYGTYDNVFTPLEVSIYKVQKDSIESMKKESYRL